MFRLKRTKRDLYEGGIRVPFIARWPETITPGKTDMVATFWDFMPTACDLAGVKVPKSSDGISYLSTLVGGDNHQLQHDFLYWEFDTSISRRAARKGTINW